MRAAPAADEAVCTPGAPAAASGESAAEAGSAASTIGMGTNPEWICVRCLEPCQMWDSVPLSETKPFGKRKCNACKNADRTLQRWFKNGQTDQKKWNAKSDAEKVHHRTNYNPSV